MRDGFKVVDADAHFYEPADIWEKYVETQYKDRCPKVVGVLGNALFEYENAISPDRFVPRPCFPKWRPSLATPIEPNGAWRAAS